MLHAQTRILVLIFGLLPAVAFGSDPAATPGPLGTTDPAEAVMAHVAALKAGDFDALARVSLPPQAYQTMRNMYTGLKADDQRITEKERAEFARNMQRLTAPDAEQRLYEQLAPFLEQYNGKYRAMLSAYVGVGQALATMVISQSTNMTPDQQAQATEIVLAATQWVQGTDWGNKDKAQQAIAVFVSTARDLGIETIDEAQALSYPQAMDTYRQVWNAARRVLTLYGFGIDEVLDSVQAKTISQNGNKATVGVTLALFGQPREIQIQMVNRDGRWYSAESLENLDRVLSQSQQADAPVPTSTGGE